MKFCTSTSDWADRKRKFQKTKLHMLVSIKESYERKLAAIVAAIAKLEEQINTLDVTNDD